MMKHLGLGIGVLLTVYSCQKEPTQSAINPADTITINSITDSSATLPMPTGDTTQNSLDWHGTYQGTLPCASCGGIETVLNLTRDQTYSLTQTYLDAKQDEGREFHEEGTFDFSPDGSYITLAPKEASSLPSEFIYFVAEGHLIQVKSIKDRAFDPLYKLQKK